MEYLDSFGVKACRLKKTINFSQFIICTLMFEKTFFKSSLRFTDTIGNKSEKSCVRYALTIDWFSAGDPLWRHVVREI